MNIDELLERNNPAPTAPGYSTQERRQLLDRIVAEPKTPGKRRNFRWVAVAAAVGLVAGLATWQTSGWIAQAQAREVLSEAAINSTDPQAAASQYWKLTTSGTLFHSQEDTLCLMNFTDVEYVAVDGSRPSWHVRGLRTVNRRLSGSEDCTSQQPEQVWTSDKAPNDWLDGGYLAPTADFVASLPRDVDQLRAKLYADVGDRGNSPDEGVYQAIADLLRSGAAPADLRAPLFKILATLPIGKTGERVVGGRTLVSLGFRMGLGWGSEVLIDPSTGELAGEVTAESFSNESVSVITREVVDDIPAEVRDRAIVYKAVIDEYGLTYECPEGTTC